MVPSQQARSVSQWSGSHAVSPRPARPCQQGRCGPQRPTKRQPHLEGDSHAALHIHLRRVIAGLHIIAVLCLQVVHVGTLLWSSMWLCKPHIIVCLAVRCRARHCALLLYTGHTTPPFAARCNPSCKCLAPAGGARGPAQLTREPTQQGDLPLCAAVFHVWWMESWPRRPHVGEEKICPAWGLPHAVVCMNAQE